MTKIERTPKKATGGITEAELAAMQKISEEWIAEAYRTDPADPSEVHAAICGLYAAANLPSPRVVLVPSPIVGAFAYGAAAWIWHTRDATYDATYAAAEAATYAATYTATTAAILSATEAATYAATYNATHTATYTATDAATRVATRAATFSATEVATISATRDATTTDTLSATEAATEAATYAATYAAAYAAIATYKATYDATEAATDAGTYAATKAYTATGAASACWDIAGKGGILRAANWSESYQGGNMWVAWCSFHQAARDVLGLDLPMFAPWERAAKVAGIRILHPEFCIVVDRPEIIRIDAQHRPHCEDGPSHRWRDGWSLYHWHGVRVPDHWIEDRANLTAAEVLLEKNTEVRRAGCEILGWAAVIRQLGGKTIAAHPDPMIGELIEVDLPDNGPARFLRVLCGTGREFALCVPRECNTPIEAQAAIHGLSVNDFIPPVLRT
jgi:hypothetical protein